MFVIKAANNTMPCHTPYSLTSINVFRFQKQFLRILKTLYNVLKMVIYKHKHI